MTHFERLLIMKLCYMCDTTASTKEHVPPRSFFPKPRPNNLWTVPACTNHNYENKLDIEYVRNFISAQRGVNETGEKILEVAKRSWNYSGSLFKRTFDNIRAAFIEGEEVVVFTSELGRVKSVMNAIVHALSYRDFGRLYIGDWGIFCASLTSKEPNPRADRLRGQFMSLEYKPSEVPVGEVFHYGICRLEPAGFVYRLVFYEGFPVYAFPILREPPPVGA